MSSQTFYSCNSEEAWNKLKKESFSQHTHTHTKTETITKRKQKNRFGDIVLNVVSMVFDNETLYKL